MNISSRSVLNIVNSFRILRKSPDGKSYAADIAGKYGLSYDAIQNKIRGRHADA